MNYTINKTLIAVLVLAIVALFTATSVSAQTLEKCAANENISFFNTVLYDVNLNEDSASMQIELNALSSCSVANLQMAYQFHYYENRAEWKPVGRIHTARSNGNGIMTITIPGNDWEKSFTETDVVVRVKPGHPSRWTDQNDGNDIPVAYGASYTAPKNAKRSGTKSVGKDSGGLRPGYITCVVAERGTCGTVNHDARTQIGMSTDTPTETTEETAPAATQKATVVRVETKEDTTETVETDERPTENTQTVLVQDETNDSEGGSGVPHLKYPVKRNRLMNEGN